MENLVPKTIQQLAPYVPGSPIEQIRREYGIQELVKLASNESAIGASPRVAEMLEQLMMSWARYVQLVVREKRALDGLPDTRPDRFDVTVSPAPPQVRNFAESAELAALLAAGESALKLATEKRTTMSRRSRSS